MITVTVRRFSASHRKGARLCCEHERRRVVISEPDDCNMERGAFRAVQEYSRKNGDCWKQTIWLYGYVAKWHMHVFTLVCSTKHADGASLLMVSDSLWADRLFIL